MALQIENVKKEAKEIREKLLTVISDPDLLELYVQLRIWLSLKLGQSTEVELLS